MRKIKKKKVENIWRYGLEPLEEIILFDEHRFKINYCLTILLKKKNEVLFVSSECFLVCFTSLSYSKKIAQIFSDFTKIILKISPTFFNTIFSVFT